MYCPRLWAMACTMSYKHTEKTTKKKTMDAIGNWVTEHSGSDIYLPMGNVCKAQISRLHIVHTHKKVILRRCSLVRIIVLFRCRRSVISACLAGFQNGRPRAEGFHTTSQDCHRGKENRARDQGSFSSKCSLFELSFSRVYKIQ